MYHRIHRGEISCSLYFGCSRTSVLVENTIPSFNVSTMDICIGIKQVCTNVVQKKIWISSKQKSITDLYEDAYSAIERVETEISNDKTNSKKRELKIEWWKKEVMPKIANLWNKQTVLKLADFDANTNTVGDSVDLSFRTLRKVNRKDKFKK